MLEVETLVIGAGPVGCMTACHRAEREAVALAADLDPGRSSPVLELVPAATVELLQQAFGQLAGIWRADERLVAWATEHAAASSDHAYVANRSVLDRSIRQALLRSGTVTVVPRVVRLLGAGPFVSGPVRASSVVDASGRAALSARERLSLRTPWIARSYHQPRALGTDVGLRVAMLTTGYVVRVASPQDVVVTVVEPASRHADASAVQSELEREAPFALEGCRGLGTWQRQSTRRASAEVFLGQSLRVGDAGFARDALSSQGLAAGISDALYAAAIRSAGDAELFRQRQLGQAHAHLTTLRDVVSRGCRASSSAWQDYLSDLTLLQSLAFPDGPPRAQDVALRQGRIEPVREVR
jgi:hypothetical protein